MSDTTGKRFVVVTADVEAVMNRLKGETESPRQDFVELAKAFGAELLSFSDVPRGSAFTRLLAKTVGKAVALAWLAFRRGGNFYFVTAENTMIPLAVLLRLRRGASFAFIGHRITTPPKRRAIRALGLFRQRMAMLCYSQQQEKFAANYFHALPEKVRRIHFQVDEKFFTPAGAFQPGRGVVAVGRELRDYPTLFQALENTGVPVSVCASSPWSKRADQTADRKIPANVTLRKGLSSVELRELYRNAAVVVVPLMNVDWPAGVTSLFEAQACGRPVVVSASDGILDSLEPGTALTVPCGDANAMREAVQRLIANPAEAEALAKAGLASVLRDRTLDQFVARITETCRAMESRSV